MAPLLFGKNFSSMFQQCSQTDFRVLNDEVRGDIQKGVATGTTETVDLMVDAYDERESDANWPIVLSCFGSEPALSSESMSTVNACVQYLTRLPKMAALANAYGYTGLVASTTCLISPDARNRVWSDGTTTSFYQWADSCMLNMEIANKVWDRSLEGYCPACVVHQRVGDYITMYYEGLGSNERNNMLNCVNTSIKRIAVYTRVRHLLHCGCVHNCEVATDLAQQFEKSSETTGMDKRIIRRISEYPAEKPKELHSAIEGLVNISQRCRDEQGDSNQVVSEENFGKLMDCSVSFAILNESEAAFAVTYMAALGLRKERHHMEQKDRIIEALYEIISVLDDLEEDVSDLSCEAEIWENMPSDLIGTHGPEHLARNSEELNLGTVSDPDAIYLKQKNMRREYKLKCTAEGLVVTRAGVQQKVTRAMRCVSNVVAGPLSLSIEWPDNSVNRSGICNRILNLDFGLQAAKWLVARIMYSGVKVSENSARYKHIFGSCNDEGLILRCLMDIRTIEGEVVSEGDSAKIFLVSHMFGMRWECSLKKGIVHLCEGTGETWRGPKQEEDSSNHAHRRGIYIA